ncbi:tetratricopeptide repeat protein [candidate division KSB1 bacterium]|nr:tetratricopeptide repeat protein [candidate division KSB1 bacterium]
MGKKKYPLKNLSERKKKKNFWWVLLICSVTLAAYYPVLENKFTNWDDPVYVLDNPAIRTVNPENIGRIFSSFVLSNYHPVTMLSYMLDYQIAAADPHQYHLTNLLIHLVNTALVFLFVFLLFGEGIPAIFAALLFGIHPLHVESVAWIAERKDVLYVMFYLAALCAYLVYLRGQKRYLFFALFLFLLALLSKAMAAPLAVTLLLVDYYRKRRITDKKVLWEKVPFFLLALIFGLVAIWAQSSKEAFFMGGSFRFIERIAFAGYGFFQYLLKLIAPVFLSAIYPYPDRINGSLPLFYYFFPVIFAGLTVPVLYSVRKTRFFVFNTLFFLVNIVLVLQLVPVGNAVMADRYSYLPSVAVFVLLAFGFFTLMKKWPKQKIAVVTVFLVYALILSWATWNRSFVWRDSQTLWKNTLARFPNAAEAWNNLGMDQIQKGQLQDALYSMQRVIQLEPDNARAYTNRGNIKMMLGKADSALCDYNRSIEMDFLYMEAYSNRGVAYVQLKNFTAGLNDFDRAVKLKPGIADSYFKRGMVYRMTDRLDLAIRDFSQAIALDNTFSKAWLQRGITYQKLGHMEAARSDLKQAGRMGQQEAFRYLE